MNDDLRRCPRRLVFCLRRSYKYTDGIGGLPKEANALQVTKYLVPRIRAWKRSDICGLSVINQQRNLPPLQRNNVAPFQQDVLDNADDQGFGLLTGLDLFRLVRNKQRLGWADETVTPLIYREGRIHPIPLHYERVGVIDGYYEQPGVLTLTLDGDAPGFKLGDELAYALSIDYEQEKVSSIQIDRQALDEARPGERVALRTKLTQGQARDGVVIYRIHS